MYGKLILISCIICSKVFQYYSYNMFKKMSTDNRVSLIRMNKSRMPSFSPEEEEELNRIISGEDFSQNVPKRKVIENDEEIMSDMNYNNENKILVTKDSIASKSKSNIGNTKQMNKPIVKPNTDWRTRTTDNNINPYRSTTTNKPIKINMNNDALSFLDFDYDDLEQAMLEEDNSSMMNAMGGGIVSKHSDIPIEHYGLNSGEKINMNTIYNSLLDNEGKTCSLERINKDNYDLMIVYADPRRMTEEFKLILNQFEKLPKSILKTSTLLVNCDDINDHRKYYKKNSITNTLLLSDPTRKLMEIMKCKANKRLVSALSMIDITNQILLKVWYEGDWDPMTTKDMLVEEINLYRKNPKQFIQSQIGLR